MKRLCVVVTLVLALFASSVASAGYWFDDEVASPSNGAVVVDTGPMGGGSRAVSFLVHSTLACTFEFQLVDTDGTTVLHKQKISIVSGQADFSLSTNITIDMTTNQRLRIVTAQALALGTVSASIWTQ